MVYKLLYVKYTIYKLIYIHGFFMGFMDNYGKWLSKIYNIIYMNPMGKKHNSRDSNAV